MRAREAAAVLLLLAPAAGPPLRGGAGAAGPADEGASLRRALDRAIARRSARGALRLSVECRSDDGLSSVRVFGNRIGIWNEARQFRLDDDHLTALLRALRAADFVGLEDTYGGPSDPPRPAAPGRGSMATLLTCRVDLALGGHEKHVVQLAKGRQSPVLKKLAEDLLAICERPGRSGLGASGLQDGLRKIARGELAPEAWVVVLHSKPEEPQARPGFLLTISGAQATARAYAASTGYGDEFTLSLGSSEVRALAGQLAARDPAAWPVNLYATAYADLSLRVLNHEKAIQARRFAGLGPATHGEHQKAFDRAFLALERIHRKVLVRGRPVS